MVSWSGQSLVEMTNDYEQVQFHDQVFCVTSEFTFAPDTPEGTGNVREDVVVDIRQSH